MHIAFHRDDRIVGSREILVSVSPLIVSSSKDFRQCEKSTIRVRRATYSADNRGVVKMKYRRSLPALRCLPLGLLLGQIIMVDFHPTAATAAPRSAEAPALTARPAS